LSLIVLPLPARLNIAYDYSLSHGLLAPPQTLFALLGLAVLLWGMIVLYSATGFTAFAIFWFLLNLLIESSIIPLMLIFEHRLYLPSTMVLLAAVFWGYRLGRANLAWSGDAESRCWSCFLFLPGSATPSGRAS